LKGDATIFQCERTIRARARTIEELESFINLNLESEE